MGGWVGGYVPGREEEEVGDVVVGIGHDDAGWVGGWVGEWVSRWVGRWIDWKSLVGMSCAVYTWVGGWVDGWVNE